MNYAVEMGSGVMIYVQSFIKIDSGIHTLMGDKHTHRQQSDHISILLFFQNEVNRLK
jgi:hypothetical protein